MGARGTILLVDDEAMLRNLIRTILQDKGYDVLVAADGNEALELSRANVSAIDLLLTLVETPLMDGISAYRKISAERPNINVLFMSGGISGQLQLPRSLPFLSKPFAMDTLCAKINEIMAVARPALGDVKVILVVDHDENRQKRTKNILADDGYAVLTANSVEEAETVTDSIAKIDLIVSGVVFPGESGVHLAEHLEASSRNINTLLISHFHPDLLRRDVGGFARQPEFLPNPFTPEALLARVRRLLE